MSQDNEEQEERYEFMQKTSKTQRPILFPFRYRRLAHTYYTFQFQSDDTLLMTYPKSGTTWGMEILWAMKNQGRLHLAHANHIHDRIYFIDRVSVEAGGHWCLCRDVVVL